MSSSSGAPWKQRDAHPAARAGIEPGGAEERQLAAQQVQGQHVVVEQVRLYLAHGRPGQVLDAPHDAPLTRMAQQKFGHARPVRAGGEITGQGVVTAPYPSPDIERQFPVGAGLLAAHPQSGFFLFG